MPPPVHPPLLRVGIDTGGTFTDCVLWDEAAGRLAVVKVPSRPDRPDAAVAEGLELLGSVAGARPEDVGFVAHGTTVATNAVITGHVPPVGIITNRGFRDVVEIGSQQRPRLYPLHQRPRTSLVPRDRRLEVRGRVRPDGSVLEELDEAEVEEAARSLRDMGVEAMAVAMLFSFANADQERRVQEVAERAAPGVYVTRSSAVSPEIREYPRFATTVINAALAPLLDSYIGAINDRLRSGRYHAPLHVMQSNGGVATAERSAREKAHHLVLSGPAAGVIGGGYVAVASGFENVVTLDIGGTSADVGIVVGGRPRMRNGLVVGDGIPLQIPAIEVETIGAGGGSIATVDAGGSLRVGPDSAGAVPGPACYGTGGEEPTLTDAHLVLGRLGPEDALAGRVSLHPELAAEAIRRRVADPLGLSVEEAARGIVTVAEANMIGAIRQTAARHGDDLRDFVLVAAGGAGPLHGARLAGELGMRGVCVPLAPGLLSAAGLLSTDLRHDLAAPLMAFVDALTPERLDDAFRRLEVEADALLEAEGIPADDRTLMRAMDLRAVGQEWTLTVPVEPGVDPESVAIRFHEAHERVYGHSAPDEPVESVTIRVTATGRLPRPRIAAPLRADEGLPRERPVWFPEADGFVSTRVIPRASVPPETSVRGPAVLTQLDSTVLVPPGHVARHGAMGNLVIVADDRALADGRQPVAVARLDPVTGATIATALVAVTGEMREALMRSSYSPIIREMLDFSCAIFTPEGEIIAQAETIPALLGAMSFAVRAINDDHPRDTIRPGDVFIVNDPYRGGTHTPDIHIFGPVFFEDRLVAWSGTLAHHADIGGTNPGTEGFANRSIFEEGLRFPPIRLFEAGRPVASLFRYIEANVREPRATLGDLRAQVAAAKLGTTRVLELISRYGVRDFEGAADGVLDRGERRLRSSIAARPDGRATATGHIDDDGLGGPPVAIVATVEVEGDCVSVDFDGSGPQLAGGLNASRSAVMAAVLFAVKAVFDPDAPANGGNARPISVNLPPGTVVNPHYPAAVSLRHLTAQRITDTVVRAFQELYPGTGVAGAFVGFSSVTAEARHPRTGLPTVPQDDCGGGMGGTSDGDGLDAVDTYLGNVGLLPAEICELQYPIRIVRTELLPDSGGPGRYRGGLGMVREYEFLDDCDLVGYTEQTRPEFAAWGYDGGLPARPASMLLHRADGREETITKTRTRVGPGDRLVVSTGGGGGYGLPRDRDRDLVRRDLREGRISRRAATEAYGLEG